mmetsp:Transcript_60684/g.175661  ORF Transcript_60684/g.175661 Transcript_60684/m.175661 type:complete len:391 (-) Transcript_60684:1226-2398(-)
MHEDRGQPLDNTDLLEQMVRQERHTLGIQQGSHYLTFLAAEHEVISHATLQASRVVTHAHEETDDAVEHLPPPRRAPEAGLVRGLLVQVARHVDRGSEGRVPFPDVRDGLVEMPANSLLEHREDPLERVVCAVGRTAGVEDLVEQRDQHASDYVAYDGIVSALLVDGDVPITPGALADEHVLHPEDRGQLSDVCIAGLGAMHDEDHDQSVQECHDAERHHAYQVATHEEFLDDLAEHHAEHDALYSPQVFHDRRARELRHEDDDSAGDARLVLLDQVLVAVVTDGEAHEETGQRSQCIVPVLEGGDAVHKAREDAQANISLGHDLRIALALHQPSRKLHEYMRPRGHIEGQDMRQSELLDIRDLQLVVASTVQDRKGAPKVPPRLLEVQK